MPQLGNRRNQPANKSPQTPIGRATRSPLLYVIVLMVLGYFLLTALSSAKTVKELSLTDYLAKIDSGQVASAEILLRDVRVQGKMKDGTDYRVAYSGPDYAADITNHLTDAHVPVKVNPQQGNAIVSTIIQFLPFLLLIVFFFWIMNNSQAGGNRVMNFGKTRAKMVSKEAPKVTFKDVAGVDEAVEELVEIKDFLENPAKFQSVGAKIPKGVLLYGPPGSGKTLLARAVAGEAGVPFLSISGSDFVEMFVGVGAARVRDLFEQAKNNAPAIVFVDEIDAVGRQRGAGLGGGHDEREQTLNQLLVEMDGFDVRSGVIMIAATNRPDILDPALLRPGRFDRQIVVDRPDLKGRLAILNVHARGKPIAEGVDLEILARRTPGFTGADLANVMNEAAILSARRGLKQITMDEMEESIDRVIAGPQRKSRVISEREKKVIAYHEAGHALVGHALPNADPVHKISIIPRGRALGYTLSLPTEDRFLVTRSEMIDELAMFLGGRVAEELVFEDPTTGAQDDIDRATKMARQMVTEYGMSAKLGPMALGQKSEQVFLGRDFSSHPDYSENIAFEIDKEIRRLLDESFAEARSILVQYRPVLDSIVDALLKHETVEKDLLQKLLEPVKKRPPRDANGKAELSIAPAPRKSSSTHTRKSTKRNDR
jgi:cell division protease FtsH